jgi:hypothetical protein
MSELAAISKKGAKLGMSKNLFQGLNWGIFRDIENKVVASTQYVDLARDNLEAFSREFVNLLFQICTNLEATFRGMLYSQSLDQDKKAQSARVKDNKANAAKAKGQRVNHLTITDYREVFEDFYNLSSCEVIIAPRSIRLSRVPYQKFANKTSPVWWQVYNDVKHDLAGNFKKASLEIVLDSLAGLFLLNVVHLDARNFLIENKVFKSFDAEYQVHPGTFKAEELKKKFANTQHFDIEVTDCIVFTSRLFLFQPGRCGENWD